MTETPTVRVNSRSTVRIVNEAIRIVEQLTEDLAGAVNGLEESIENNLLELRDLASALRRKYPIMRVDD